MKKWLIVVLALCLMAFTACGSDSAEKPDWGITLTAENVTPTGCTLICTQSGGNVTRSFETGTYYFITKQQTGGWKAIPTIAEEELAWNALAYGIQPGESITGECTWGHFYGALEPGNYRICKMIESYDENGSIQEQTFWAEFTIQ